jgi:hypothetical protein
MGSVDYRLLDQWEAGQRWRRRARAEEEGDAELEAALVRALRHIDKRRAESVTADQLVELDDR